MKVLVFDTETTGLPEVKYVTPETVDKWPYIVQFSYIIYDTDLNDIVETKNHIIKLAQGIEIPEYSTRIHGITNKISQNSGTSIQEVLRQFFYTLGNVDLLVGHNISFDINMLKVELIRSINEDTNYRNVRRFKNDLYFIRTFKNVYCTLQSSIELCNIEATNKNGEKYLKYPNLTELHQKLFDSIPNNLHNSYNDILITLRCFINLKYGVDLNEICPKFYTAVQDSQLL